MSAVRIAVTAMGLHTALDNTVAGHAAALRAGRPGLSLPSILPTRHSGEYVLGEIKRTDHALRALCGIPVGNDALSRTTLLALSALREIVNSPAGRDLQDTSLAFINAGTVGGMGTVEQHYLRFVDPEDDVADVRHYIDTLDCAETTTSAAEHYGWKPLMATISTACSSSANALLMGARLIRQGVVDRAICGGADALTRFSLNGFMSLKNMDPGPCKPFDEHRSGLNLGEGAAYLLLEREEDALSRGVTPLAILSGWHNCNDAYHPTAPSPEGDGALAAMQGALACAGLSPEDISGINAHGTATLNNDASEGKAIERLFGPAPPPFSSTKPYTGHTLAAAGSVEAILSIIALREGFLPPVLNFSTPMADLQIRPSSASNGPLRHMLSNSFGFGGANASLIFSQYN